MEVSFYSVTNLSHMPGGITQFYRACRTVKDLAGPAERAFQQAEAKAEKILTLVKANLKFLSPGSTSVYLSDKQSSLGGGYTKEVVPQVCWFQTILGFKG